MVQEETNSNGIGIRIHIDITSQKYWGTCW